MTAESYYLTSGHLGFLNDSFEYFKNTSLISLQATHRQMGAGLGARGSAYQVSPGDSYKDSVKKVMYQRFQELE